MVTNVVEGWRPRRFERQFYRRLGGRGCFSATAHRHRPLTARSLFLDAAVVTQKRKAEVPPFRSAPTGTKKSRTKGSVDTSGQSAPAEKRYACKRASEQADRVRRYSLPPTVTLTALYCRNS